MQRLHVVVFRLIWRTILLQMLTEMLLKTLQMAKEIPNGLYNYYNRQRCYFRHRVAVLVKRQIQLYSHAQMRLRPAASHQIEPQTINTVFTGHTIRSTEFEDDIFNLRTSNCVTGIGISTCTTA